MKKPLLAATLLGAAACANTQKNAVSHGEGGNTPKVECCGNCGGDCDACPNCTSEAEAAAACEGEVCPVTGARGGSH